MKGMKQVLCVLFTAILASTALAALEPADLTDLITTSIEGYEIYYTNDAGNASDFFSDASATDIANTADPFVQRITALGFKHPWFSVTPEEIHIYDSANIGTAPENRITIDSPNLRNVNEPGLRTVIDHEHFHHTQFAYIKFNDWPSWGRWTVEGTARLMQDKLWNDLDANAGVITYWGEVSTYLANTQTSIIDQSYAACLFWQYLCEQVGKVKTEPEYGVDVILDFWKETDGQSPDSLAAAKRMISDLGSSRSFDDLFQDFAVANYTKDKDISVLNQPERFRYVDDDSLAYDDVNIHLQQVFPPTIGPLNGNVQRYGVRYYIGEPQGNTMGGVVGFKSTGDQAGYAVLAEKSNKILAMSRGTGTEFARVFFNSEKRPIQRVVAVVSGLDSGANYNYTFTSGAVKMVIKQPDFYHLAWVGPMDSPKNFMIRVQVSGPNDLGGGTVWGLQSEDFTVTVGSKKADIISGSYVQGEFWLNVQAPVQDSGGPQYNLTVQLGTIQAIQNSSVIYGTIERDGVLVVDGSGSMLDPVDSPKIVAAKTAADLFIDTAGDTDNLALVSFGGDSIEPNEDAVLQSKLVQVGPNRVALKGKVNNINIPNGGVLTALGDGLYTANTELANFQTPLRLPFIVLLSDGMENEARYWNGTPSVKNDVINSGAKVISVALGPQSDQALMQSIATQTGGYYYYVDLNNGVAAKTTRELPLKSKIAKPMDLASELSYSVKLADVYKLSQEHYNQQSRLWEESGIFSEPGKLEHTFTIKEDGIYDAIFIVYWPNIKAELKPVLIRPDGSAVKVGDSGVAIYQTKNHVAFHISDFSAGKWALQLESQQATDYIAILSGQTKNGIQTDVRFIANQITSQILELDRDKKVLFLRGLPIPVNAMVTDKGGPVTGAEISARILCPDGNVDMLPLFDDGKHNDQNANDGIYGNVFRRTTMASQYGVSDQSKIQGTNGSYMAEILIQGIDNDKRLFTRINKAGFQVFEFYDGKMQNSDPDGDIMPTRWENLYGLNSAVDDAAGDADNDGLRNLDEYILGTIPTNPDTDSGGESDLSEAKSNRNNSDYRDDSIQKPVDCGVIDFVIDIPENLPLPNGNLLYFPISSDYARILVYRGDTPDNLVLYKDLKVEEVPGGLFADKELPIQPFYYQIVAVGKSGAVSAPSRIFKGIAKADPIPPKGWVKINNGISRTDTYSAKLQLDAYDDIQEMMVSNDPGFNGAVWQASKSSIDWTLQKHAKGDFAIVYAKFRDASSNESSVYHSMVKFDFDGDPNRNGIPNMNDPDNDGDGLPDEFEFYYLGFDPFVVDTNKNGISDGEEDYDRDGLNNLEEQKYKTNPNNPDTDRDGWPDGEEIRLKTDPTDPKSFPTGIKPTPTSIIIVRPTPTRNIIIKPTATPTSAEVIPTAIPTKVAEFPTPTPAAGVPTPTPVEMVPTPTPTPGSSWFPVVKLKENVFELYETGFTEESVYLRQASNLSFPAFGITMPQFRFGYGSPGMGNTSFISLQDGFMLSVAQGENSIDNYIIKITPAGEIIPFAKIKMPAVLVDNFELTATMANILGMSYNGKNTLNVILSVYAYDNTSMNMIQGVFIVKIQGAFNATSVSGFKVY